MKPSYFYLLALLFITACFGNDSGKFPGVWQNIHDPSQRIMITKSDGDYFFETSNLESDLQGVAGTYNTKEHALDFDNGRGTVTRFVYNVSVQHMLALGKEFEKVSDDLPEVKQDETTSAENSVKDNDATRKVECEKGDALVINGNNVRLRQDPDVTKQNILMKLNKGYEVVRMDEKTVDGQIWYKVCYDGQTGWVSGQYAVAK